MAGPPTGIGTLGLIGVIAGVAGIAGTAGLVGVAGTAGVAGIARTTDFPGGPSAAKLLVRGVTLLSRAFNARVVGCDNPPAAGSISSPPAPHLCAEST